MGLLSKQLNEIIDGDKSFGYNIDQFMFETGFPNFDYCNGQVGIGANGVKHYNIGIDAGKTIMIAGKPGSGKTTLALQIAYNVSKKYDESDIFVLDFEQSHTEDRIKALTGMDDEYYSNHVTLKKVDIYTDTVLKLVKRISKFKKEHEKEYLTPNKEGVLDADGKPKMIMPPTFVIVDSIASMKTEDYQEGDELNSLTVHGRQAIINKDMINRIMQPCMVGNVIVIFINHITTNMSMGVTPPESQTRYLKNTEAISGGVAMLYLCNLLLKVEAKDKLEEKDKYGIKGFMSLVTIVKSRNSEAGKSTMFVFNQAEGFERDLSLFEYLKANNLIKGAGVGLYLDGYEQYKFRMSNLKEKLEIPEFREAFETVATESLKSTLKLSSKIKVHEQDQIEDAFADELDTVAPVTEEAAGGANED